MCASMRNLDKRASLDEAAAKANVKITVRQLDVEKPDSVAACFQDYIKAEGKLDVLINNAGQGEYHCVYCISFEF